jgi:hypothetical protein
MTLLVFFLLAVLWGAVFIPAIVRARLDSSPIATVGMFRRGMRALGASERAFSGGRWVLVPPTPEQVVASRKRSLARHRQVLSWLILAAVMTLVFGILPGLHVLLKVHVAIDVLALAHVVFLVKTRRRRLEVTRQSEPAGRQARAPARRPAPRTTRRPASQPASRQSRIIDLSDEPREALYVFEEDEEDHGYLKAGQF